MVNNQTLPLRPLLSRNKRIILSNVCPSIPHDVLVNKLAEYGVKTASSVQFLRAGLTDPNFSHILSFRRQVYINPDDEDKLPEYFQIVLDDVPHRIFVSCDSLSCFVCKQSSHKAANCPNASPSPDPASSQPATDSTSLRTTLSLPSLPPAA